MFKALPSVCRYLVDLDDNKICRILVVDRGQCAGMLLVLSYVCHWLNFFKGKFYVGNNSMYKFYEIMLCTKTNQ